MAVIDEARVSAAFAPRTGRAKKDITSNQALHYDSRVIVARRKDENTKGRHNVHRDRWIDCQTELSADTRFRSFQDAVD